MPRTLAARLDGACVPDAYTRRPTLTPRAFIPFIGVFASPAACPDHALPNLRPHDPARDLLRLEHRARAKRLGARAPVGPRVRRGDGAPARRAAPGVGLGSAE